MLVKKRSVKAPITPEDPIPYCTLWEALKHRCSVYALVTTQSMLDVFRGTVQLDWSAYPYAAQFDKILKELRDA